MEFILAAIIFVGIMLLFFFSDKQKKNGKRFGLLFAQVASAIGMIYFSIILVLSVHLHATELLVFGILTNGLILAFIGELWN